MCTCWPLCTKKMNENATHEVAVGSELDTKATNRCSTDRNQGEAVVGSISEHGLPNTQIPPSHQCPLAQWEILGNKFQDYKQSCPFLTIPQQREQLYSLLPFFHQVCELTSGVMSVPYMHLMASDLGTLLAVEMRKRISNKPAGAARLSLTSFLQGEEECMSGYLLLKSVYLLSRTDQGVLSCLIKTGLPDVFLESLYLFLAYPPGQNVAPDIQESESLVQNIFMKTMLNLCSQAQGVEDLTKSSDFECLFKAAASGWDQCDIRWSGAVEKLLKAVSRTVAPAILHYLQSLRCVPSFLQTLTQRVNTLQPSVLCQVTVILLSFLSNSYTLSSSLLQDFENSQGYPLLLKVLLRCEGDTIVTEGGEQHLDELLKLLASLVVCGRSEVKVSVHISHPQLPGFCLGRSTGSGGTVKNLQAFQVLQGAFQNSMDAHLCVKVLSTIQSLWAQEHNNFFLLECSLQPISQFVEIIPLKPHPVHIQFFQMIRFVVSELSYIPHQTLQKVQDLIKQNQNPLCTMAALNLLQSITPIDSLFNDLFRDSGLLGMLLTQLRNHAKFLRRAAAGSMSSGTEVECERELTIGRLHTVGVLLQSSVRNVVIIKDYEMIPYIKVFLDDMGCRREALCILEHLSVVDPNEYMSTIMGALCSATQAELTLKLDLLQSLQRVLRSPREKSSFRNAAGFDVLLSSLSDMERSLCDPPVGCWSNVQPMNIIRLIHSTLSAMSAALFQDITNQKFVQKHGIFQRLAEDLMQLGCFETQISEYIVFPDISSRHRTLYELLNLTLTNQEACPESLKSCFLILSFLLSMARGTLSKEGDSHHAKQITIQLPLKGKNIVCEGNRESESQLQDLIQDVFSEVPERYSGDAHATVEPGALCVVISLIQDTYSQEYPELSKELQCAVLEHILALSQSERQRQVLCESQLLSCIVRFCKETLKDYLDPLRLPLVRLFEKLASQSVQPDVLRQFLCCGITMKGSSKEELSADEPESDLKLRLSSVAILHTSVSLVTMTSPRQFQTCNTSISPSFVEFDMSTHGYGFLFLPTIGTLMGSSVDEMLSGGEGTGSRSFPPSGGLTFTIWFLVSKFSSTAEQHPLRFLTVVRHMSRSQQHYVCLSIAVDTVEKCLVISTEEQEFQPLDMMEVELPPCSPPRSPAQVRLRLFGRIVVGQWHHLSVVLNEVRRSCLVSASIDGHVLGTAEMQYIERLPGASSSLEPSSLVDIHAFLGTPRMWRQQSALQWRLGHAFLFEEALSEDTLLLIQRLGPSYCGNIRNGATSPLLAEEKIVFGVNILSSCFTTITQIKETYNEVDGRHVAKELGITSKDNCTPIFLARNLASHLLGAARTFGAVTIDGKGVRFFHSSPAADTLNYIGGPAVILSLVSMASDDQALYASIKALVSVLSSSPNAEESMEHIDGYRLLGFLLRQKAHLINPRIFQLLLTIAGTADLGVGPTRPLNLAALKHILCDFQLYVEAPGDLDVSLFLHLEDFLRCPREIEITQEVQLVDRLVFLLSDHRVTATNIAIICKLLSYCLSYSFSRSNILRLGLLLVSTLPAASVDETQLYPRDPSVEDTSIDSGRMIWLRNQLLGLLIEMMCLPSACLSEEQQEDMLVILGVDWFLLFVQPSVHTSSVVLGMRLLGHILQIRPLLNRFKEVVRAGAYVENSTYDMNILMDNIRNPCSIPVCSYPLLSGFVVLRETIGCHVDKPEIYLLISSTFLRSPLQEEPTKADLDSRLQNLLQNHSAEKVMQDGLCVEAALLLLMMVKVSVSQETSTDNKCRLLISSNSVMQFFCLIYHNYPRDTLWVSADFINLLANLLLQPANVESCVVEGEEAIKDQLEIKHEHSQSVRKTIQELMHLILRESLTHVPIQKQDHPFECLLETLPADGNTERSNQFQTEILQCAMEMFYTIGRRGEQLGTTDFAASQDILEATAIANLSYFSQKLLEKMHCNVFVADPCEILIFFIKQIKNVTQTAAPSNRESLFTMLYSCLNRSILHCMARPRNTLPKMLSLLKVLELLLSQWDEIFTTYNSSLSFATCLMHCLFQIYTGSYLEGFGVKPKPQRSSWQMIFLLREDEAIEQMTEGPALQEMHTQVLHAVQTVWEQLMVYRRQSLEEHYNMDLSVTQGEIQISQVTPLWEETTSKAWQQYLVSEKKNLKTKRRTSAGPGHRMVRAVRGLYGANDEEADFKLQDVASTLDNCKKTGQEVFKCLYRDHQQMHKCEHMAAGKAWLAEEEVLLSEGGVWGSLFSQSDQRRELSPYEGPWRVRKRMQSVQKKLRTLLSGEKGQAFPFHGIANTEGGWLKHNKNGSEKDSLTFFPALRENLLPKDRCAETLYILQEFPKDEKILVKMPMVLVEGHLIIEGVLLFGRDHFYLCPHFTLSSSGQVACSIHGVSSIQDPFIYDLCFKDKPSSPRKSDENPKPTHDNLASPGKEAEPAIPWAERYSYHEVMELKTMNFLMQEMALEIFFVNRITKFLVFPNKDVTAAKKWFQSKMPSVKGKGVLEDPQYISRITAGEKVMLQRWQKREVGNFEYLMYLNSLSGRTIRDLMQYPVLPWVLQDYQSEVLNLSDPKVFRDLSKPMGAQSRERCEKFIQRYKDVEKNDGEMSVQCHYCTHYSSSSIVSSYLVRVEPFTQAMRCLQGGSLDLADRLFHSVSGAWESASNDNMSDVRELIPEFYYLPEMFVNCKHCHLGYMQDGTVVGDVILPPWAHGDPHSFIRLHREALESEYVSSQLHHWIDLIFGYKQRGAAAVQALNAFHPYFYGSQTHLNCADTLIRNTVIGFITNFGQVPKQLFTKPHPTRQIKEIAGHQSTPFYSTPCKLKHATVTPRGTLRGPVGQMLVTDKGVFAVEKNHIMLPPTCVASMSWGHSDGSLKLHNRSMRKVLAVWELMTQWGWCHDVLCPSPTLVITAMSSSVLCVWHFIAPGSRDGEPVLQLKKILTGHGSAVLCVCASVQYGVLISGSADGSCVIWDLDKLKSVRWLPKHPGEVTRITISDSTGYIASYCASTLYLWSVNGDPLSSVNVGSDILSICFAGLSMIVTGSENGTVKLWKMDPAEAQKGTGLEGAKLGTSLHLLHQLAPGVSRTGSQQRPAAVTALAVSRNFSKLLVGDERGTITSWHLD
ncbi:WD repeat- and FYVE domain-containing protein 4 [Pelobates fuscus]|uniref:WD repeat- and FYVE domain-containing protein 4 n=1 Tax=Pelobates fuscus TaxID=191477 RepID=UPI002FE473A9